MKLEHVEPKDIEARSFAIIEEELTARGITLPSEKAFLIKRAIHTTADFDYAHTLCFSENVIEHAQALIRGGAVIVTDTNMALAGINKKKLSEFHCEAYCFMADQDVAAEAASRGVTRATVSVERAAALAKERPVIYVVGNAPTALIRLREFYDADGFRPDLVIGVPVGFVNVEAAKELIIETELHYIINRGRKGGSNVAAAIMNSLLYSL